MHTRFSVMRLSAVSVFILMAISVALWSTGDFPPVALANSGGSVTYYTLTKCTPTGGAILNSPTGTSFISGTVVQLTADPVPGYDFNNWTGVVTGGTNPINITMNGNKSVCATFVADSTKPVITRLGDATVHVECGGTYTDAGATATDNRDGTISSWIVVGGDTIDTGVPDTYTVTYNVIDQAENSATQVSRTVIVQDTTPPSITLVGAEQVTVLEGDPYTDLGATATDACDGDLTDEIVVGGETVVTELPGQYSITYDVADSAANAAAQVVRTVNVVSDVVPPEITLLGDNPLYIQFGMEYLDPGVTAGDNIDGDVTAAVAVGGDTVDIEDLGTYEVLYDVTDSHGNSAATKSRTVVVIDSTPPVLTLQGLNPHEVEFGATYIEQGAEAVDNVDGDLTGSIVIGGDTVNTNSLTQFTVLYDVEDNQGNQAVQLSRLVVIVDTTAPVLELVGDNPLILEFGTEYHEYGATAIDSVEGDLSGGISIGGEEVLSNQLGEYLVTYNIADSSGNGAIQLTRIVEVVDTTPPVLTLNGANPLEIPVGTPYTDPSASAIDDFHGNISHLVEIGGDVVNTTNFGTYVVIYSVTDPLGNIATPIQRSVIVHDPYPDLTVLGPTDGTIRLTPPNPAENVFDGDPDSTFEYAYKTTVKLEAIADTGFTFWSWGGDLPAERSAVVLQDSFNGTDLDPRWQVEAGDWSISEGGALEVLPSSNEFPTIYESMSAADYTLSYAYNRGTESGSLWHYLRWEDESNYLLLQISESHFRLREMDNGLHEYLHVSRALPSEEEQWYELSIKCEGNSVSIERRPAGGKFEEVLAYQGVVTSNTSRLMLSTYSGASFGLDNFLLKNLRNTAFLTMDSSKTVSASFIPSDTTIPVITLIGNSSIELDCGEAFVDPGATATDNRYGDLTDRILIGGDFLNTSAPGTYTITYNVSDEEGNTAAEVSRTISVGSDNLAPEISIEGDAIVYLQKGAVYEEAGANAIDLCQGEVEVQIDASALNTQVYGSYSINYDAVDASGNIAPRKQRVVRVWPTLSISVEGEGTTTPVAPAEGEFLYFEPGSTAIISAAQTEPSWVFDGWRGAGIGNDATSRAIVMSTSQTVTAEFVKARELVIRLFGEGSVAYGEGGLITQSDVGETVYLHPRTEAIEVDALPEVGVTEFIQWSIDFEAVSYESESTIDIGPVPHGGKTYLYAAFAPIGTVEFYNVTLAVEGSGTTVPEPGNYRVPRFSDRRADCMVACQDDVDLPGNFCAGCNEGNEFSVVAEADPNWVFKAWRAPGHVELEPQFEQSFEVHDDMTITARFIERPGASELDLLTAMGEFFVATGEIATSSGIYSGGVDWGDFRFDFDGTQIWAGNGIPDAAEISLLLSILVDPHLDLSRNGGIAHTFVWEDFVANQAQAALDLPSQTVNIQNTVAAYMTLGSYGHMGKIVDLVAATFAVELNPSDYTSSSSALLDPFEDADGDGTQNRVEWQLAPTPGGSNGQAMRAWSYPNWALDPDAPATTPLLASGSLVSSYKSVVNEFPTLSIAKSTVDCDCGSESVGSALITVNESANVEVVHRASCGNLAIATPTAINLGRGISLNARESYRGAFTYWNAPGTLINGSNNRTERFTVTGGNLTIQPFEADLVTIQISDDNASVSVLRGDASKVIEEYLPNAQDPTSLRVTGPRGTVLQIGCSNCDGWEASEPHFGAVSTAARSIVLTLGADDMEQLDSKPRYVDYYNLNLPFRTFTHYVESDGGGSALIGILEDGGNHGEVISFHDQASAREYWGAVPPRAQHHVKFYARPNPGYQFKEWIGLPPGPNSESRGVSIDTTDPDTSLQASAVFVQKSTLQWRTKALGADTSVPGDCIGYCRVSPAQKFYSLPTGTADPDIVQVIAVPQPGYSFAKWVGRGQAWTSVEEDEGEWIDVAGSPQPINGCTIDTIYLKMADANNGPVDHDLYAVYSPDGGGVSPPIKLTVNIHGLGDALRDPEPHPLTGYYQEGTVVTVTPDPEDGWQFEKWGGEIDSGQDPETTPVQVTMSKAKTIDLFLDSKWELKLNIVGEGSASRVPDEPKYETGTEVTCTATAAPGWQFTGWKGKTQEGDRTDNPTVVEMDFNKEFDVIFLKERLLTVNVAFDDGITVTPGVGGSIEASTGSFIVLDGQKALLEVYPDFGNVLARWEGPNGEEVTEEGLYAALVMDADKEITAVFEDGHTINALVNGPGTIAMAPVAQAYRLNQQVGVTVHPAPGWSFAGWIGDTTGIADIEAQDTTVTVSGDMTIQAAVTRDNYTLILQSEGPGMIEAVPNAVTYPSFDVVEIVPTALPGTKFDHWENGEGMRLPEYATEVPLRLRMDGHKTIRGVFRDKAVLHIDSEELIIQAPLPGVDGTYPIGTEVTLTAAPTIGKMLQTWEGDAGQTAYDPLVAKVLMDSDKYVKVTFEDAHVLTVNTLTGPSATTWPGDSKDYIQAIPRPQFWFRPNEEMGQTLAEGQFVGYLPASTEVVNLKARDTVGDNQIFHHWEDDQGVKLSRDLELELEISGDTTVNAVYIDAGPRLTVNILGEGTATIGDDLPKEYRGLRAKRNYSEGDVVSIHADPIPGYYFDHWVCSDESADLHDTTGDLELTVTEDTIVSAIFIPENDLIVFDGDVNEDGAATQADVDIVRSAITAKSSAHSKADSNGDGKFDLFDLKWAIDAKAGRNQEYMLFLDTHGLGLIEATAPGSPTREVKAVEYKKYPAGTPVTLQAVPETGWRFDRWVGASQSRSASITVALNRPELRLYAKFVPAEPGQDHTDPDNDGLSTFQESIFGTDPAETDTDGDGLPDGWEIDNSLDPKVATGNHGAEGDQDHDGLSNLEEYQQGLDPLADEEQRFKVYIYNDGDGEVALDSPQVGYKKGHYVYLQALERASSEFDCWEGDWFGNEKAASPISTYSHVAVRGHFRSEKPLIVHDDTALGRFTLDKTDGVYLDADHAHLTAIPKTGERFVGWSGTVALGAPEVTIEMNNSHFVTPVFEQDYYVVKLNVVGSGQHVEVSIDGEESTIYQEAGAPFEIIILPGQSVELRAVPDTGEKWTFRNWRYQGESSSSPWVKMTPTDNVSIYANFSQAIPMEFSSAQDITNYLSFHPKPYFDEISNNIRKVYYPAGEVVRAELSGFPDRSSSATWILSRSTGDEEGWRHENALEILWPHEPTHRVEIDFHGVSDPLPVSTSLIEIVGGPEVGLVQVPMGAEPPENIIVLPPSEGDGYALSTSNVTGSGEFRLQIASSELSGWSVENKYGKLVLQIPETKSATMELSYSDAPFQLKASRSHVYMDGGQSTNSLPGLWIGTRFIDELQSYCNSKVILNVSGGGSPVIEYRCESSVRAHPSAWVRADIGADLFVDVHPGNTTILQYEVIYAAYNKREYLEEYYGETGYTRDYRDLVYRGPQGVYVRRPYSDVLKPPSYIHIGSRRKRCEFTVNYAFGRLRVNPLLAHRGTTLEGPVLGELGVPYSPKPYKLYFQGDHYINYGTNATEELNGLRPSIDLVYASWTKVSADEGSVRLPVGESGYAARVIDGPSKAGEYKIRYELDGRMPGADELLNAYGDSLTTEVVYPNAGLTQFALENRKSEYNLVLHAADFGDHSRWLDAEISAVEGLTSNWLDYIVSIGEVHYPGTEAGRLFVSEVIEKIANEGFQKGFSYANPDGTSDSEKVAFFMFEEDANHKLITLDQVNGVLYGAFLRYVRDRNIPSDLDLGISAETFEAWRAQSRFERKYVEIGWKAAEDLSLLDTGSNTSGSELLRYLDSPGYKWPPEDAPHGYLGPWQAMNSIVFEDLDLEVDEIDNCRGQILDDWVAAGNSADWETSPVPKLTIDVYYPEGATDFDVNLDVASCAPREVESPEPGVRRFVYEGFAPGTTLNLSALYNEDDHYIEYGGAEPNTLSGTNDFGLTFTIESRLDWERTLAFSVKKAGRFTMSTVAGGPIEIVDLKDPNEPIVAGGMQGFPQLLEFPIYEKTPVRYFADNDSTGCFLHWALTVDEGEPEYNGEREISLELLPGVEYVLEAAGAPTCQRTLTLSTSVGGSLRATHPTLGEVLVGPNSTANYTIDYQGNSVVSLTAEPVEGYRITRWLVNGEARYPENPSDTTLTYDLVRVANTVAAEFKEVALVKVKKKGPGPLRLTPLTSVGAPDPEFPSSTIDTEEAEVPVSKSGKLKLEIEPLEGWRVVQWSSNVTDLNCSPLAESGVEVLTAYICTPEDGEEIEVTMEFDPDVLPTTSNPESGILGNTRGRVPWGGTYVSNMPPYMTDPNWADPSACPVGQDDFAPAGDPVHPYSGEVFLNEVDLRIPNPGGGPDFVWARTYRSRFGENTDLGNGWDYSYNIRIEEVGPAESKDSVLLLRSGNGRRDYFSKSLTGVPVWTRPEHFTKIIKENGLYKVLYSDGSLWSLYPSNGTVLERGRIKTIQSRLGHFIDLHYYYSDTQNLVPAMRITGGWRSPDNPAVPQEIAYEVKVSYRRNLTGASKGWYIHKLTRMNGVPYVTYLQSEVGDLVTVTPEVIFDKRSYTYSTHNDLAELRGNLLTIANANGDVYVENVYFPTTDATHKDFDRIHTQRWGGPGDILEFDYSPLQPTSANQYRATKTTVTDRRGNQRILYFDQLNRGIQEDVMVRNAQGNLVPYTTRQFWDDNSLCVRRELPNGAIVAYVYDENNPDPRYRGRLLRKTIYSDPETPTDQVYTSERYAYGDENCGCDGAPTDYWDGKDNHTQFIYNDAGNVEEIVRRDGSSETLQYETSGLFTGRIKEHRFPPNESGYERVLSWKYNLQEQIQFVEHWDGERHRYTELNQWGNPLRSVDPKGNETFFRYLAGGRVPWREFVHMGNGTYYGKIRSFDENGNVKSVASGKVNGNASQQIYFIFDPADWQFTEFTEYDILNRLKRKKQYTGGSITGSNGVYSNTGGVAITTEFDYDAEGNLSLLKTGQATSGEEPNNIVEYQYDERNLVTMVKRGGTDPKAVTTDLKYDAIGNLVERSIGNQVTTFVPDGFGRLKTTIDAMGNVLTNTYDSNGNVTNYLFEGEIEDAGGGANNKRLAEVDIAFDAMNRPFRRIVRKFDPALASGPADVEVESSTKYNALGQPTEVKDASGFVTLMRYSAHGELETLQRGRSVGAYFGSRTRYEYDRNGNIEFWEDGGVYASQAIDAPEVRSAYYEYDALNRPKWTFSGGKQNFLTYDSRSNVTKVVDAEGNETHYTYDNLNRPLTASSLPNPADPTIFSQGWDHNNRLEFKTDGDGNQTDYQYDVLDRLERMDFAGQVEGGGRPFEEFGYDALGRLETHKDRNGATVTAHYDKMNRLTQRDFVASAYEHPVFTHEYFKYDGASRMVEARNDYSKVLMRHDSTGNLLSESLQFLGGTAPAGPFEVSHTYDTLGRPTLTEYPGGRILNYAYNVYNQDLSQISEGGENLVNYGYYTRDLVGRKNLGPESVVGSVLPGQHYPGSWDDGFPVTEPAASITFAFRETQGLNPSHRIGVESLQFEFNRSGGVGADPYNPPPLSYDERNLAYTWDRNFNKSSAQDSMPGFIPSPRTSAYEYDHLNRLADSSTQNSGATSSMVLDYGDLGRLGNRDSVTLTSDSFASGAEYETYALNPAGVDPNAYVTAATTHPDFSRSQAYDDNGNLISIDGGSGNTRTLGYDPHNRLVQHSSNGGLTTKYRYDALGRRIQSTIVHDPNDPGEDEITRFLYSGHRVIEERDGEDNVLASYVYGRGLDEVVSMRRDVLDNLGEFGPDGTAEDYFYLGDMQNNSLVLVDADGKMVEAYAYGTELRPYAHFNGNSTAHQYPNDFGMPVILDEDGAVLHANFTRTGLPTHYQTTDGATAGTPYASRYGNPWLFNGRAWDAELGLYHYRNRYLDPVQGRFTTRDPIGIWGDPMNLGNGYSYVGNNPWTYVDPFGLLTWQDAVNFAFGSVVDDVPMESNVSYPELTNVAGDGLSELIWTSATLQAHNNGNEDLALYLAQEGFQLGVGVGVGRATDAGFGIALEYVGDTGLLNRFGRWCTSWVRSADEVAENAPQIRLGMPGGSDHRPPKFERFIEHGERIADLIEEGKGLTYWNEVEYAIFSLDDGRRVVASGGMSGFRWNNDGTPITIDIDGEAAQIRRVIGHTHPQVTGPSDGDLEFLELMGQRSSYIYEVGGGLTTIRPKNR